MFLTQRHQLIGIAAFVLASLSGLTYLLLLNQEAGTVLAQDRRSNYEAFINAEAGDIKIVTDQDILASHSDDSGIEVVPVGAFRNDGDNADNWIQDFAQGRIRNTGSELSCFMAPTYPPDGATLTEFRYTIVDDSPLDLFAGQLRRVHLATGAAGLVAGGSALGQDSPTPLEFFDNTMEPGTAAVSSDYAYYVTFCLPAGSGTELLFYGARLFYTPAS